jgi:hypothetical protein
LVQEISFFNAKEDTMKFFTKICPLAVSGWLLMSCAATADEHWTKSTPFYEEDAWYDVSEWLDGNDYNPTDEVLGMWDDESYGSSPISTDQDNDIGGESYGFNDTDSHDDWFYDYYDYDESYLDEATDGSYGYKYEYYDYDNDGFADAYASWTDADGDGIYEDYNSYRFGDFTASVELNAPHSTNSSDSQTATNDEKSKDDNQSQQTAANDNSSENKQKKSDLSSKRLSVTGTVERTKRVSVPLGPQRLIAEVKGENDKMFLVDLGPSNQFGQAKKDQQSQAEQSDATSANAEVVTKGEKIVAHGPAIKVGDKQLIVARKVKIGDADERTILRAGRTISGKISKMKTAKVRGQQHQLVIIDLESGKQALVDLGPKENLPTDLKEGSSIEVTGVPTKIQDRFVFMANSITKGGDRTEIDRMTASATRNL